MNTIKTEDKIEIKPGYKKTAIGIIPKDWEVDKIKRFTTKIGSGSTPRGGADVYIQNAIPFIRSQNVNNNILDVSDNVCIDLNTHIHMKSTTVYPEDVLLNITGASIGRSCVVPKSIIEANVNQHVCIIRLKKDINNIFIQSYLSSFKGQKEILRSQTGGNREGINHKSVGDLDIPIPPLPEQKAIADCLSTWDKGIEKLSALIASKKEQKKGLMQQLLTGKKRLKGFTEEWKEMRLGDIAYITTGASNKQDAGDGFKYVFFDRSSDVLTSKIFLYDCEAIIVPGEGADFIPKYFVGKFDLHQRAYAIMDFKNVLGKYIFYYLINDRKHLHRQAVGSTVKSLRLPYFKNMPMRIPSFEEQTAIANILQTADKEIELLEKKLEAFKIQKKGLMQVLLTGTKRLV